VTSRVTILTSGRWGGGVNDCTSTEDIHGKTVASPSEWSLTAYRGMAALHKVPVPSSGPLLNHKRNVGRSVAISNHGVPQMNSDEVNWLLQTIEDPENAKRFVQAQYQRRRIPYRVMASLAWDRNWTDWPAVEKPAALISVECITTRQGIPAVTMP
jgi:hypothetical protein